jgi:hypothetical protein
MATLEPREPGLCPSRAAPVSSPAPTASYALPFRSELRVPTFVSAMPVTNAHVARRRAVTDPHGGT